MEHAMMMEVLAKIKAEMEKLKESKDETVKAVYESVTKYVSEIKMPEEPHKEEMPEAPKKEEMPSVQPPPAVPMPSPEPQEEKKAEKELSAEVAKKLEEAALELDKFSKDVKVKDELLSLKDKTISELNAKLEVYQKREQAEIELRFNQKVDKLSQLYNGLGIKKDSIELKKTFNEEQMDKLIIDLSAMQPKPVITELKSQSSGKRLTPISLELSETKVETKEQSSAETINLLFGL